MYNEWYLVLKYMIVNEFFEFYKLIMSFCDINYFLNNKIII